MTTKRDLIVTVPVLPLSPVVLFPGVELLLEVRQPEELAAIEAATQAPRARLLTLLKRDPAQQELAAEDLHPLGVLAEVLRVSEGDGGARRVLLRGLERKRAGELVRADKHWSAGLVEVTETPASDGARVEKLRATLGGVSALEGGPVLKAATGIGDAGRLADYLAGKLQLPRTEQAALLAELSVDARLGRLQAIVEARAAVDAEPRRDQAKQRQEILRQRKREILAELGQQDDGDDKSELDERITKAGLPPEAEAVARKQAARLAGLNSNSPEEGVTRNYLEWLLELPWSKRSEDRLDVPAARAILDADHQGLEKVKRRILEYLAVRKLKPGKRAPILLLAGPPGVGKTSLGRSVARALGREFVRISLGGVRDEAEVRGHRRTYVGALPGRIIQGLKRAGTQNPVMMLDEIDKLSADFRGDPAAALLEVLDPEQNNTFSDHYLELPFDLSQVIFIATANDLSTIAAPLFDRMELLSLPGYPTAEKRAIARTHLVPKQLREHGLDEAAVHFGDGALDAIIEGYTREAGVRNLEREIGAIVRAVAVKVASGETFGAEIGPAEVEELLGPARFVSEEAEQTQQPGVSTGMAWTPTGGEILFIEATRMPGHGKLVLTGQLGEVMRESAMAALSYVRSHAASWGIPSELFERSDLHLHVPAGATPKDGPSAGNALVTAIVSLLTGRPVRGDVAMTGEITLRGAVLPVGGVASKVLAAHRAGIKRVILPERNGKDLAELPADVRAALEVVLVKRVEETLAAALTEVVIPSLYEVPQAQLELRAA